MRARRWGRWSTRWREAGGWWSHLSGASDLPTRLWPILARSDFVPNLAGPIVGPMDRGWGFD